MPISKDLHKAKEKTKNEELRNLEIKFYCLIQDLCRLSYVPSDNNIVSFLTFLKEIDLTTTIDFDIIETLVDAVIYKTANLEPKPAEWYNFVITESINPKSMRRFFRYNPKTAKKFAAMKIDKGIYQPIHLRPPAYEQLRRFLELVEKVKSIGV